MAATPSTGWPGSLWPGGRLRPQPAKKPGVTTYRHDPSDPVPTIGGRNLYLKAGPMDQRQLEERDDVVVFSSEPLAEDREITGRVRAIVYFASAARSTDVVVRLCDVYPDGRSVLLADGIRRLENASDKNSARRVDVDLWSTSIVLAKGHRIRVSIASSNSPAFAVNPGTGRPGRGVGPPLIQENTLFCGGEYPSRVILPQVPAR